MEVCDTVQEAMIKTIPKKNKCKKAKWLSEEALQTVEKRREEKGKGEKERYTHLNAEFHRITRREKKAFLSDHCKEIEENNRMGKMRTLQYKLPREHFMQAVGGLVAKSCPTLVTPWTVAHQAPLSIGFPSKNTGVGCHFLLQGIVPTQESNLGVLHCRQILSQLSYKGSPK